MPKTNDLLFQSADLFLPTNIRNFLEYYYVGNDKSVFYLTNWSILHFVSGILVTLFLLKRPKQTNKNIILISFLIHTLWEVWQIYVKKTPIHTLRGQIDVFVDTLLFMSGVFVSLYFKGLL
jgi:hypothetical protein